jgi:hypothetical protein
MCLAQEKPDFTGVYKLDSITGNMYQGTDIPNRQLIVTHADKKLKVVRNEDAQHWIVSFNVDGKSTTNTQPSGSRERDKLHFEGHRW